MRWRVYVARALQRLTVSMRRPMSRRQLRETLASALEDPPLQLAYRHDDGWIDETGRTVRGAAPDPARARIELSDDEGPVALLDHDAALSDDREFLTAVAECALTALERERTLTTLEAGLKEIERSRARLVADADTERRRMERDLHDGAQQRLVALRIRLELAANAEADDGAADPATLRALGEEVGEILEDMRSLAGSVYPPRLAELGLPGALRSAALTAPLPTDVDSGALGRYPEDIETAVYFVCLEALQNAVKHAAEPPPCGSRCARTDC
jgi:signal transduction histidine kinase